MEKLEQRQPKLFPEWAWNPQYLPSMEDLKNLQEQNLWTELVHHNPHGNEFQILTQEFIDSLSDFLSGEIETLPQKSISILEVGAGNGRLTHFLKEAILKKIKDKEVAFKAVDDFSWHNSFGGGGPIQIKKIFDVEEISAEEALKDNPDIIISSWMPKDKDWTKLFRDNKAVKTFILIGEESNCGTKASWKSDKNFQRNGLEVEGSVSWSDFIPGENRSKVAAFIRNQKNK